MLYIPELSLAVDKSGTYTLLAKTHVLSSAYSAGTAIQGAPAAAKAPAITIPIELPITFNAGGKVKHKASADETVEHTVKGLKLQIGSIVMCYVTLKDAVLGEASIVLVTQPNQDGKVETMKHSVVSAVAKAMLVTVSAQECMDITIKATPAGKASSSAQQLHELGVVDDNQVRKHQDKISTMMSDRGSSINPRLINSGKNVTVAVCAQSVFLKQGT